MGSRRHKIGSIYSRMTSLLLKKGTTNIKKPLWYDIYTHFPPDKEPCFRRRDEQEIEVREILYPEDVQRVQFHKALRRKMEPVDLTQNETETQTQRWIKLFNTYIEQGHSEDEAVKKIIHSNTINIEQIVKEIKS